MTTAADDSEKPKSEKPKSEKPKSEKSESGHEQHGCTSGAEYVVQALLEHGVSTVFGYPGGAIMPLYDALYESPMEHILCRHEQGAAMSAVGFARASGKAGVCIATSGPGATNLVTGLAEAMLDSIPLVALTGQVPTSVLGTDAFQEVDMLGLSLAVTKHSFLVSSVDELPEVIEQAFRIAQSGRPGPVLIDLPKDILQAIPSTVLHSVREEGCLPMPEPDDLEQARVLISNAKKPMLYAGGGVGMASAVEQLRQFQALTGMPSVVTLKGLGSIAPQTAGYLGMLGMHGTQAANLAVQECDLLVCVGARFDDRVTGRLDGFAPDAKVIHLDIDRAEFGKRRQPDVALQGDLCRILPAIAVFSDCEVWQKHCQAMAHEYRWQYNAPGGTVYAPALLNELSQKLPINTVVSCDVGQHQMWVAQHMSFSRPENHLSSGGLGTMGFGLPAAIGAALSRPDDTVVCVSGDGSIMMNIQELTTLRRLNLPVKIVLLDNERLGMVRQWQTLFFDGRHSETNLSDNPDFIGLAKAFGVSGKTVWQREQVTDALEEMLASDGPYFLHVAINAEGNVWPLVPPGAANHQMLEGI
ncbi:acetolactate synthase 2 catalytic subunit [Parendozoicomonas sp. Alg238-R29]|uniref:acetolactate synthase 2 catalytic subunit n=1 Tax=Parendozoicomonas sp. Alg238-R29 TaxID=2993446 RepID=UPI00248E20FE|nr:acetolactate synthase 2 catalytic subunit [Parendozoicomonas sp. Alg238-R29]